MNHSSHNPPKKPKNLWPYGILTVIFIGVVLITVSIYISVKNPIYDDMPFFLKHTDTDSRINEILESSRTIQEHFNFYIQANDTPTKDSILKPYSPYLRPPHRDKDENSTSTILFTKSLNTLHLLVDPIDGDPSTLHIRAFIQKLGRNAKAQEIYVYNTQDGSFIKHHPIGKSPQILIGEMVFDAATSSFLSPAFEIDVIGRWIVSFQITAKDMSQSAILEKEFMSAPKDELESKENE